MPRTGQREFGPAVLRVFCFWLISKLHDKSLITAAEALKDLYDAQAIHLRHEPQKVKSVVPISKITRRTKPDYQFD
jgi:hypothetical protein